MKLIKLFFLSLLVLTSCKVYDKVPRVGIGGFPQIKSVNANLGSGDFILKFNVPLNFHNPFNKNIPIPKHKFTVYLNNKPIPLQAAIIDSFTVPKESDLVHNYPFELNLNPNGPLKEFIGRDNLLTFKVDIDVNLKQAGIKVPAALTGLLSQDYRISFSFSDTVRVPNVPEVLPSTQIAGVKFLGQMETFDLTAIKDGIEPFVNILRNQNFNDDYISDAANSVLNAKVKVIKKGRLGFYYTDVTLVDYIADLFGDDLKRKLNDLKDQLKPGKINILEHTLNRYYSQSLGDNAKNSWNNFKNNWDDFLQKPLKFTYPGTRVTGIQLSLPFKIKNTNAFAINIPTYSGNAVLNNNTPVSVNIKPQNNISNISANQIIDMVMEVTFNWSQGGQGIMSMINGASLDSNFNGSLNFDLGYGPVTVPYNFPLKIKFGQ